MHSRVWVAQTDFVRRIVVLAVTLPKSLGDVAATKNVISPMQKN